MINLLAVLGFTLGIFGLYCFALTFSRYRQRRRKNECRNADPAGSHRCAHCTCDIDPS